MTYHHWLEWNDFAEEYIRIYRDHEMIPTDRVCKIIYSAPFVGSDTINHLVEFQAVTRYENTKVFQQRMRAAPSMSRFVFPNLHFARWHRPGGSMMLDYTPGALVWLEDNLMAPILGIKSTNHLYLTSDSSDDLTLAKLRFGGVTIR